MIYANKTNIDYNRLFYDILRIRMLEKEIAARYPEGKMRCPTHLSIGQETVSVAVCDHLFKTDIAVSTHRAHAHYLAKGGDLRALIAELYGKVTGCVKGRGGSMHLSDLKSGFIASSAIVGNTIPIGVGLAFSQKLKKSKHITCIFLGDAAIEEGVFYESLNFSVLKKLPVLFICENNLYSVNTPLNLRQPSDRPIYKLAESIGAKSKILEGNDMVSIYQKVGAVIENLRQNGGPWFLEFETYRYKVHCGPEDDFQFRPKQEVDHWLSRDPIKLLQSYLIKESLITPQEIDTLKSRIQIEIDEAFDFAEKSPFPLPEERFHFKYAENQSTHLSSLIEKEHKGFPVE